MIEGQRKEEDVCNTLEANNPYCGGCGIPNLYLVACCVNKKEQCCWPCHVECRAQELKKSVSK